MSDTEQYEIEEPTATTDTGLDMGEPAIAEKDIDASPENVVETCQKRRMHQLLNNAPLDKDEMSLMNDLTRTAQTQQRITTDNKSAESDSELSKTLMQVITSGISLATNNPVETEKDITPQLDDSELGDLEITEELVSVKKEEISLDEIMSAEDLKVNN